MAMPPRLEINTDDSNAEGPSQPAAASQPEPAVGAEGSEQKRMSDIHGCSYFFYYCILFFAYWFGSARFDFDGDGDFDPEDVQAFLAEKGWITKNFEQSQRKRRSSNMQKEKAKIQASAAPPPTPATVAADPAAAGAEVDMGAYASAITPKSKATADATPSTKKTAASMFDRDGNGVVDMDDFLASQVEGEAQEEQLMKALNKQRLPWFMIFECCSVFFLWLVVMIKDGSSLPEGKSPIQMMAGLDSFAPGMTVLRWFSPECEDWSPQAWRWFTYQFTHVGAMHVSMNVFLCVMMGIPLEGIHGWWRMAIMFNVGVMGGGLLYYVSDGHNSVVGCSGGCYSLIGIHIADLIMNWHQKKFRIPTVIMLLVLIGIDLLSYFMSISSESASHAAHIGGSVAGVIIGILVCRNSHKKCYEYVIMVVAALIGVGLMGFCLYWIFVMSADGPINFWEDMEGEEPWCWFRAVYKRTIDEQNWLCARCRTPSCINLLMSNFTEVGVTKYSWCQEQGWWYDEVPLSGLEQINASAAAP